MDTPWLVVALVILIVLAMVYTYNADSSTSQTQTSWDLESITLLRQDIPHVTFDELYNGRFPFDVTDSRYQDIKNLERVYSTAVHRFVYYWNETVHLRSDPTSAGATYAPEMFTEMTKIEESLKQLYDVMMQYCNVESDAMRTFEVYSDSVHDWFHDLSRRNQGLVRGLA